MCSQFLRWAAVWAMVSILGAFAAAVSPRTADAAGDPLTPVQITPSSGCTLLTAYAVGTGISGWSSPAPPCGTGPFTLAFNQGSALPLATGIALGWGWDGRQRAAGVVRERARGSKDGLPDHGPSGSHDQQGGLRSSTAAKHCGRTRLDRAHLLERRHLSGAFARNSDGRSCLRLPEHRILGDRAALCAVGLHLARKDRAQPIHGVCNRGVWSEHHARRGSEQPLGSNRSLDLELARESVVAPCIRKRFDRSMQPRDSDWGRHADRRSFVDRAE